MTSEANTIPCNEYNPCVNANMVTHLRINEPFLKHLNVEKTAHIIVTAEDHDFDTNFLQDLHQEGFNVRYVAMDGERYIDRIHEAANAMTGINEHYSIVAFGDAAARILEYHTQGSPRLVAIVAYYPTSIPDPSRSSYPLNTTVLIHLAGETVGVRRRAEVLGVQGKPKTIKRRLANGIGLGGEMKFNFPSYKYNSKPGFAEADLEDYDSIAAELAWSRSLRVLREAFGFKVDIERIRDEHLESIRAGNISKAVEGHSKDAQLLFTPTMTGVIQKETDLERFYREFFSPSPQDLSKRLISRTTGVDRIVDEIELNFKHDKSIPWLLPGISPTNKRVEVILISIVCIKGGLIAHERLYWDQASVLLQIGLLDERTVSSKFKDKVNELPIMGSESARIVRGDKEELNELIEEW